MLHEYIRIGMHHNVTRKITKTSVIFLIYFDKTKSYAAYERLRSFSLGFIAKRESDCPLLPQGEIILGKRTKLESEGNKRR